jgi:hypothetical protein
MSYPTKPVYSFLASIPKRFQLYQKDNTTIFHHRLSG